MPPVRNSILALFCLALTGCSLASTAPGFVPPLAGLEGASVIATDKTLIDHYVSYATGKNCSIIRREQGRTYCEEDELGESEEVYCYRTLGNVNCYAEPVPGKQQWIGHRVPGTGPPR